MAEPEPITPDTWNSPQLRSVIVSKIGETMATYGVNLNKSPAELERSIFQKTTTKEQYLAFVGRLINHFKNRGSQSGTAAQQPQLASVQQQQPQQSTFQQHVSQTATTTTPTASTWDCPQLRQHFLAKIDQTLQTTGNNSTNRSPVDLELSIYQKAANKEQYSALCNRLIYHLTSCHRPGVQADHTSTQQRDARPQGSSDNKAPFFSNANDTNLPSSQTAAKQSEPADQQNNQLRSLLQRRNVNANSNEDYKLVEMSIQLTQEDLELLEDIEQLILEDSS